MKLQMLPLATVVAAKLHSRQAIERKRREEGLPPIRPYVELIGKRDTGYIAKGLKGHVVCETDEGFIVVIHEDDVLKYLAENGIKYHSGRVGHPDDTEQLSTPEGTESSVPQKTPEATSEREVGR